jgi:hypothetical protein
MYPCIDRGVKPNPVCAFASVRAPRWSAAPPRPVGLTTKPSTASAPSPKDEERGTHRHQPVVPHTDGKSSILRGATPGDPGSTHQILSVLGAAPRNRSSVGAISTGTRTQPLSEHSLPGGVVVQDAHPTRVVHQLFCRFWVGGACSPGGAFVRMVWAGGSNTRPSPNASFQGENQHVPPPYSYGPDR